MSVQFKLSVLVAGFALLLVLMGYLHQSKDSADSSQARSDSTLGSSDSHEGRQYFHGYECSDDCSGHEAGYRWAAKHNISDPEDCGGNSESFIEGCKAYAGEEGPESGSEDADEN